MVQVTMPCIDYSSSGHHKGVYGPTGFLWIYAMRLAIAIRPWVIFSEMSDFAPKVNGGAEVRRIQHMLKTDYVVHQKIVKCWDYGDGSRRRRWILCCFRKDVVSAYVRPAFTLWATSPEDPEVEEIAESISQLSSPVTETATPTIPVSCVSMGMVPNQEQSMIRTLGQAFFCFPEPLFNADNPHTARDTAVPDSEVPEDHWRYGTLTKWYAFTLPVCGEMHMLGRLAAGIILYFKL